MKSVVRRDDPSLDLVELANAILDAVRDGREAPTHDQDTRARMILEIDKLTSHATVGLSTKSDAYLCSFLVQTNFRREQRLAKATK